MRKSISAKIISMIAILGLLTVAAIVANVNAYVAIEDWLAQITEQITVFEESIHIGDMEAATVAEEGLNYLLERLTVRIVGTRVFNKVLLNAFVIVGFILGFVSHKLIAKPAKVADMSLKVITDSIEAGEGDLTLRVEQKTIDETGRLVSGINTFIEQLQGILLETKRLSGTVSGLSEEIAKEVTESNEDATNISAVMEELSASMEEITATLEEIAGSVHSVSSSTEIMDAEIQMGQEFVTEMNDIASKTNEYMKQSQEEAINRIKDIRCKLEEAIENSQSVEKITTLADEILDISDQTNLLSLNASIEAARAGNAGRGFAVVASEISKLSASSKNTANNIQNVNELVSKTVSDLVESANGLLQFLDEVVLNDYEKFGQITGKYQKDAIQINELLTRFYELSNSLNETMHMLTENVDGINRSVEEGALGIGSVAESTTNLVSALTTIQENVEQNNTVAEELMQQVKQFKNL